MSENDRYLREVVCDTLKRIDLTIELSRKRIDELESIPMVDGVYNKILNQRDISDERNVIINMQNLKNTILEDLLQHGFMFDSSPKWKIKVVGEDD